MRGRMAAILGALATALTMTVAPSIPAGAAASGPAPTPNPIALSVLRHIATVQFARQDSVTTYTVQKGDTLSSIAQQYLSGSRYWPLLWWSNKAITNPDVISIGQILTLPAPGASMPAKIVTAAMNALPKPKPVPVQVVSYTSQPVAQQQYSAPAQDVSTSGMSAFEACVISRESGGNPQIWNPTGHWGLMQFDLGTWESGGGTAANFGNADAAVQEQVFANVYAARGTEPWAPSDGC